MRRLIINNTTIDDTTDCFAIAEIGQDRLQFWENIHCAPPIIWTDRCTSS